MRGSFEVPTPMIRCRLFARQVGRHEANTNRTRRSKTTSVLNEFRRNFLRNRVHSVAQSVYTRRVHGKSEMLETAKQRFTDNRGCSVYHEAIPR